MKKEIKTLLAGFLIALTCVIPSCVKAQSTINSFTYTYRFINNDFLQMYEGARIAVPTMTLPNSLTTYTSTSPFQSLDNLQLYNAIRGMGDAVSTGTANAWNLVGNSVGNNTSFLGSKDNRSLIFKTNNTQRLKIDSNGVTVRGTQTYTDQNIWTFNQGSANTYYQSIIQNSSNGNQASTDFVVSNDLGTKSTYYGNFGMNSSTYTGSTVFDRKSAVYLTAQNGDLSIGTTSNNSVYFGVNKTMKAAKIDSLGGFSIFADQTGNVYPLTINGNAANADIIMTSTVNNRIQFVNSKTSVNWRVGNSTSTVTTIGAESFFIGNSTDPNSAFFALKNSSGEGAFSQKLRIGSLVTPSYNLDVTGNANISTGLKFGTISSSNIHTICVGNATSGSVTIQGLVGAAQYPAFYAGAITPAAGNYWLVSTGSIGALNGSSNASLRVNGSDILVTSSTGAGVTGNLSSTGSILSTSKTLGVGYAVGSGSTVTQGTSRTTGVTINDVVGAITLFSTAGSATWQSFTVTNSAVAATDLIIVNQKSGTDLYMMSVTAVAAGSFRISFATTGGTTSEAPVFNFAVIKGVSN